MNTKTKSVLSAAATLISAFGFVTGACALANWIEKPTVVEITKTETVYVTAPVTAETASAPETNVTETVAAPPETIKRKYIGTYEYVIPYGDSLFRMGMQSYSVYVDVNEVIADIMYLNGMTDSRIYAGDVIILPIYPDVSETAIGEDTE